MVNAGETGADHFYSGPHLRWSISLVQTSAENSPVNAKSCPVMVSPWKLQCAGIETDSNIWNLQLKSFPEMSDSWFPLGCSTAFRRYPLTWAPPGYMPRTQIWNFAAEMSLVSHRMKFFKNRLSRNFSKIIWGETCGRLNNIRIPNTMGFPRFPSDCMGMCTKWKFRRIHLHKSFPVTWLIQEFFQKSHFRSRSEFRISFWLLVPRIHVARDWSVQCGPGVRHCRHWNSLGHWSSVLITVLPAPKYRAIGRKCVSSLSSPNLWLSWLSWALL